MAYYAFVSKDFEHHGVLGMKWGIRRYQPYPKGQKVKGGKEVGEAAKVKQRDKSANLQQKPKKKNIREASDEELRKAINRMNLEKQYIDLMKSRKVPDQSKKKGESLTKEILRGSTKIVGSQVAVFAIGSLVNYAIKQAFHTDIDVVKLVGKK